MSGILDSKTRILDTIVTLEGRRQLSMGGINIRYVSFTDSATFYSADFVSGSSDATLRTYLEACHLPQDRVTFQADDLGRLLPFDSQGENTLRFGQVIDYSFNPTETIIVGEMPGNTLTGDSLSEVGLGLLTSSIDNYVKQMAIGSRDPIFDDEEFAINTSDIEFTINEDRPVTRAQGYIANVNHIEDVFSDPRFSHMPNFKYLPPINRIDHDSSIDKTDHRQTSKYQLGNYPIIGRSQVFQFDAKTISDEHSTYAQKGYSKKISFDPTSRANNLFIQAFEISNDSMFKMDIIDFGTWYMSPVQNAVLASPNDPGPVSQIFFIGKLITKPETQTHAFVHLFTMFFGAK